MKFTFISAFLLTLTGVVSTAAELVPINQPCAGIAIHCETRTNPATRMFVAEVNWDQTNLQLRVVQAGPDPDAAGPWQTTLIEPTRVAAREGFQLVVNGDFFRARGINDGEGTNSAYRADAWAAVLGPAASQGRTWAVSTNARPALIVHDDRSLSIESKMRPSANDVEVLAGNTMLVEQGAFVGHTNKVRHPRTAAGLTRDGCKLILLVVDGRKPGVAVGMSYDELAVEMKRLGCWQALNLDGGGSSVMAVRDGATGAMQILNQPTDGHERPVANMLGITCGD